ncbi:hypothetical protein [Nocardioides sambongensis]|uniref:hypothetical protein n=1 Tax=Nocardioides sambongensis TaxID=2589074 RepID=UPI001125D6E8|nr:hypothetical protein [Nocardioides sambongensis]
MSGMQIGGGGLHLGHDSGFPVSDDYAPPFRWTGTLRTVTFSGAARPDGAANEQLMRDLMRTE